jgi:hypothetical protein
MIKKQTLAILIVPLTVGMMLSFAQIIIITPRFAAYGQNESLADTNNIMATTMQAPNATLTATNNSTAIDTFSAEGTIGSLVLTNMTLSPPSNNATNPTTSTPASVLPGKTFVLNAYWQLKVDNGNVTSFVARFTKVHLDATNGHTHEIANFTSSNNNVSIKPNVNGTTLISGISDVALNNATAWSKVTTTKNVNDLSTITISLDPSITSNHFNGQSIYGIVNTLKDKSGNQFINFPSI